MEKKHTIKIPHIVWEAAAKEAALNRRSTNGQLIVRLLSIYKDAASTQQIAVDSTALRGLEWEKLTPAMQAKWQTKDAWDIRRAALARGEA